MRMAIISDIHGNRTAFEAVLADVRQAAPDLVLHGGDLADGGSSPIEIVDRIRDLGWQGVVGNTDEMLFRQQSLIEFARQNPKLESLFASIGEMAAATRATLGDDRLEWLRALPCIQVHGPLTLLHASPNNLWRAPGAAASHDELKAVYGTLGSSLVVYGHVHVPYIRESCGTVVANSGSVGLPYDGDPRAAYLLVDAGVPMIRRIPYVVEREIKLLSQSGLPHAEWTARMLRNARFEMP